jgi:hypothetical protein
MNSEITRDDYILELCSAKSKGINEIVPILKQNEAEIKNEVVWKSVYGITGVLYENFDLQKAYYLISRVANEINYKTEYELFGMGLDETFYLYQTHL